MKELNNQILAAKQKHIDSRFHGNDGAVVTADTSALEKQIDEMVCTDKYPPNSLTTNFPSVER